MRLKNCDKSEVYRDFTYFCAECICSGTLVTCYLLSFGNLVVNQFKYTYSCQTENIKRGNLGVIIQCYYLIQNINVDGLMRFFACNLVLVFDIAVILLN
jgi:hypothetical protein